MRVLDDGGWHASDELVVAGMNASDVLAVTVGNMIGEAHRAGVLKRKGRRGLRWYRKVTF